MRHDCSSSSTRQHLIPIRQYCRHNRLSDILIVFEETLEKSSLMHKIIRHFIAFLIFGLLCASAYSDELITVAWRIKPPHQYIANGVAKGILLERAKLIFSQAKINTRFVEEPAKRIWNNFAAGTKNYCSFGWYRIPERESIAQFSGVFHSDPPHTILVTPTALKLVAAHPSLSALLADSSLTLGIVDSVSYGPELDTMIKNAKTRIERSTTLPMNMARMIAANRASFMFIDRADWEYLKDSDEYLRQTHQIDLPGMPPGQDRYIVCSKDIKSEQMQRINGVIQKINKTKFR